MSVPITNKLLLEKLNLIIRHGNLSAALLAHIYIHINDNYTNQRNKRYVRSVEEGRLFM